MEFETIFTPYEKRDYRIRQDVMRKLGANWNEVKNMEWEEVYGLAVELEVNVGW